MAKHCTARNGVGYYSSKQSITDYGYINPSEWIQDHIASILPGIDLIFTIDVTGSMVDDIDQVKVSSTQIVDEISNTFSDWRIALVDFQDFPVLDYGCPPDFMWYGYPGDWPYRAELPFSTDKTAIKNAINELTALCGADEPESIYSALIRSINTESLGSWRNGVKKVVIYMTDSYPHDPEPFTGYTIADVKNAALAVDPAVIYPIIVGGSSIAYSYGDQIAEETGGKAFSAPTASDVVEAILEAVETASQSPIAEAGGPYSGNAGIPITFDASGSYDPDGIIVSYEWDWDNDGTYDETTTSPTIQHTWNSLYSGIVRLRVTDNDGLTAIDTASVEITNPLPVVNIIFPLANAALQDGVTFAAEASDVSSIDKLYFYVREPDGGNGTPIGYEDLEATFNTSTGKWEYNFDTTVLQDGYYVILAKAIDTYGNEGWGQVIPVSIRNWTVIPLLPSSANKKAGSTMPVKFSLRIAASVNAAQPFVYNEDLEIRIYDVKAPGTILQRSVFGTGSKNYRIDLTGQLYITNFQTSKTPATYVVEIWRPTKNFLVGSFTFKTTK